MGIAGYENLIAGLLAGFTRTVVGHPLDLLRIRYAVNDHNLAIRPHYHSYFHVTKCIIKAEGIRGLFQGLTPNLISTTLVWGLYFHLYHIIHPYFDSLSNVSPSFQNLAVGFIAGAIAFAASNPFMLAKTRLCLQYENQTKTYRGMTHCLWKTFKEEGIKGWYKGFYTGLWGTLNVAVQFAIYNYLKDWRCRAKGLPKGSHLETMDYLAFSAISKFLSTASTYPYQVIRTRLQDQHTNYKSSREVIYRIFIKEGFMGFYKGMLMATLKQLPNGIVTYVVYEYAKRMAEMFA